MKQFHVLLGDEDSGYVDAVVEFFMGTNEWIRVHSYTDPELFEEDAILFEEGEYDAAAVSGEFLRKLKESNQLEKFLNRIPGVLQLAADDNEKQYVRDMIPKYQAMDQLLMQLERFFYAPKQMLRENSFAAAYEDPYRQGVQPIADRGPTLVTEQELSPAKEKEGYTAVYSPANHELMLPAALLYAQQTASEHGVILLDMEENSRLFELIGRRNHYSLTDYLYLREKNDISLDEVLLRYDNVLCMPIVSCPMELCNITSGQWQLLLEDFTQRKEKVVFVFGSLHQGSSAMLDLSGQLFLIERKEAVYQKMQQENCRMLARWKPHLTITEVGLGLTVGSDSSNAWDMEDLKNSNLAEFIRIHMSDPG